jgi:uncharacterized protein (TIGR02452 family)
VQLDEEKRLITMVDRRRKNVNIFDDTMDWIKKNKVLNEAVVASISNQKLYLENKNVEVSDNPGKSCATVVSTKRSFEAAAEYARSGKKVCVLNFASATNPGGGVTRGSSAQEECLCKCSTLYPCLNEKTLWNGFYSPHRRAKNPLYNDDCIYTPGVYVCKSDISFPERMDEKDWYQVDVLTCAAPNLRNIPNNLMNPFAGDKAAVNEDNGFLELYLQRIERIFRVAATNKVEVLILGAFGCGAFCNPPEVVAKAFSIVQKKYESYFDVIEYAVFCGGHETKNYDAFCDVFESEKAI